MLVGGRECSEDVLGAGGGFTAGIGPSWLDRLVDRFRSFGGLADATLGVGTDVR